MRVYSLDAMQDNTGLLPHLIGLSVSGSEEFADYMEQRTLRLYNVNSEWRRKMHRLDGRDMLYAFAAHWWQAWTSGARMPGRRD